MMSYNEKYQIAYACNDKVFDGLYLSILSIVKRTKHPIHFYLFSTHLTEMNRKYKMLSKAHINVIEKIVKHYNPDNVFTVIDCKKLFYKRCNKRIKRSFAKYWTPYTTFRLLFDMCKQISGNVLYLDTDTMVCGDISAAFKVDMSNTELCVTSDIPPFKYRLGGQYFNAGSILINVDMARKTKFLERAFNCVVDIRPPFCDQDALNLCSNFVKFRPDDRYNRILPGINKNVVIRHFAGKIKPWESSFIKKCKEWNELVWLDDIEEWKQMKRKTRWFNKNK